MIRLCSELEVNVQNLAGGASAYRVPASAIVADLKRCVAERLGVAARRVRLILPSVVGASADLDDAATLAASGVTDGMTLHVFVEDRVPCDFACERVVGSQGSGTLQFSNPLGVCLSPSGAVLLVSDSCHHRVQALRVVDLAHLYCFGSEGSGPGQLQYPCGVCASGDFVHIADHMNKRVSAFLLDGTFVRCSSRLPGRPTGICVSASGEWLCVADDDRHRVHVLRAEDLALMRSIGTEGSGAAQFSHPRGVCLSPDDTLVFVADQGNHRVQVLRFLDGAHVRSIGSIGSGPAQFIFPYDVCVAGAHFIVADHNNHRVQVLTLEGVHVRTIGHEGVDAGQFNMPSALCVSAALDLLCIVEERGHRVQLFSA